MKKALWFVLIILSIAVPCGVQAIPPPQHVAPVDTGGAMGDDDVPSKDEGLRVVSPRIRVQTEDQRPGVIQRFFEPVRPENQKWFGFVAYVRELFARR